MTAPLRFLLVSTAVAATLSVTLAGCNRDKDKAAPTPAPAAAPAVAPTAPAAPFDYESKSAFSEVKLTLSPAVQPQPELHAKLYADTVKILNGFNEGAQADRSEAGGDPGAPGYEKDITFDTPVETARLFSLAREDYEFTGGAHGMTTFAGVLWDKATKTVIAPGDLFRKGANLATLDAALCAAINVALREQDPTATPVTFKATDIGWACPRVVTTDEAGHPTMTPFILTAGTVGGKAGGLTFLIGPYIVGPYANGSYEAVVPQSAFRALINPAYADEFAGDPVKPARPAT